MTNEMKLLRAFIEASGFDIKEIDNATYGEVVPIGKMAIGCGNKQWKYFPDESVYKEVLGVVDYKVTKKKVDHSFDLKQGENYIVDSKGIYKDEYI